MATGKTLSGNVHSKGEEFVSPSIGLISGVLPEVQRALMSEDLQSGVSTSNVPESPPPMLFQVMLILLIGMSCVLHTDVRRKHTIIYLASE